MIPPTCACSGLLVDGGGIQDHGSDGAPCLNCGHRADDHEPPPAAATERGGRYVCTVAVFGRREPLAYATNYDRSILLKNGEPNPDRHRAMTDKQIAELSEDLVKALRALVER